MKSSFRCSTIKSEILWAVRLLTTLTFLFSAAPNLMAATTITVMWDRNPEPDVVGYIISYGTQPATYTTTVDVGNVTSFPLTLADGQRYYLVVQAYNTSSQLSAMSAEVQVDLTTPAAPSLTSVSPASGTVGAAVTISGANFGATQGPSTVTFNGTVASPTSWSSNSIGVPVPAGATTGNVVVTVGGVASNGVTFTVTASGLPAPWVTQDVGNPALAGQATYTSGTFTVTGAGADIWDVNDQFRFVYQPLNGDGEIVARVTSLQNTDQYGWAKAGVMIREDLAGNAPNAVAEVTAANGMIFQSRTARGGVSTSIKGFPGSAPRWIRAVRSGSTFTGYTSADGVSWTLMGSFTIAMSTHAYIGISVTSHNPSVTTNATFTNVSTTAYGTGLAMPATTASASVDAASAGSATVPLATAAHRAVLNDYDGDGRSDVVYRPSTGGWQVLASGSRFTTGAAAGGGAATDLAVPGDYDGDGKADMAYYRPSTGVWSILTSGSNFTEHREVLLGGGVGDVPVPGDYDGDGIIDVAIYSPAVGQWWILTSSSGYTAMTVIAWGTALDVPVPGDYDGDGKTDIAVYRPSTGQWKILGSRTGYATDVTLVLGTSTDIPVPADYDGDGISDLAVFQPSTGLWLARLSGSGFKKTVLATLGGGTDVPVPGDFDGDGKADIAVFHDGTWHVLYSGAGYASGVSFSWGRRAYVPVSKRP